MSLEEQLSSGRYAGYAYGYPHKSAYRPLSPVVPLDRVWQEEDRSALFLYVHIPFCEMRCGFCNLFTTVGPQQELTKATLSAIELQSRTASESLAPATVAQAAFGGGTPSFLTPSQLARLFERLSTDWKVDWSCTPLSFEVTPTTATLEKLTLLSDIGVDRISMGVQSFEPEVLKALGRPQQVDAVRSSCGAVKKLGFKSLNLDLIYGAPGQTPQHWNRTLEATLELAPEEIYLYPLYVRALTGLGKTGVSATSRRELYRQGREFLLERGYEQVSMRHFRLEGGGSHSSLSLTEYTCQEDGMVGLGPGARSYTRALHYSSEYAVSQLGVKEIIRSFGSRSPAAHIVADYGIWLSREDQKRRHIIKSLLHVDGLDGHRYRAKFSSDCLVDFPELRELTEGGFARISSSRLALTDEGFEASDTIGPWFYSELVRQRMDSFQVT
ncbi:MAG: STM4012 family radical SAM protein [Thermoanaerobaculia bacterium]|nr:STM4012 family radical SAM protein [Thermoanaerobaculia bacterium]